MSTPGSDHAIVRSTPIWTVVLLAALFAIPSRADSSTPTNEWPQFRGPASDGATTAAGTFESPVGVGLRVAWKKELGSGYSSIAVAGGRVVTAFSDGADDVVVAFDEATGDEQWRFTIGPTFEGLDGSHTGPLSTPLVTGTHVVALGPRGKLFGLNAATGEAIWSTDLVEAYGAVMPHYGFSSSPLLVDGMLVLELGAKDASVAGFDIETGERVWSAGTDSVTHQNPALLDIDGRRVLVAAGQKHLTGIDPANGEVLWQYDHQGGGARGVMSLAPVPAGNGEIFLAFKDDSSALVRYSQAEDGMVFEQAWENRAIRNSYNVPVYHDGYLYAFSTRFLTCVDAETGETKWRSREPGDGFLILVDGHLVIVTKSGGVHVVKASPDGFEEVAGMEVFTDLAWSPPGFADGRIFVRSLGEIARIDITEGRTFAAGGEDSKALAGSAFGQLLNRLRTAENKQPLIDAYMKAQQTFPVIEGTNLVHFIYRGPGTDVAVASELFGARQERPMKQVEGTDLFYYSMRIEPDARTTYLFIQDYEGRTDPLNPRTTVTSVFKEEMEINFRGGAMEMSWFAMPGFRTPDYLSKPDPARVGRIESEQWQSAALGDKKVGVDVYLPAGYDASDERYPVVYVHSGRDARKRGQWTTALDNLIGTRIRPVIVAFIRPLRAQPQQYVGMFAGELIPMIDEQFRTIAAPEGRASVGMGFAGPTALACATGQPGLVGKLATQSSFMFSSVWDQIEPTLKSADKQPLDIYMDWGKYDYRNPHEAWDMGGQNREIVDAFRRLGYDVAGGETHDGTDWSSWMNRTDLLLEAMFPMKNPG